MTAKASLCQCGRPIKAWQMRTGRRKVKKPSPDHDLCQKCWKASQDRSRMNKTEFINESRSEQ